MHVPAASSRVSAPVLQEEEISRQLPDHWQAVWDAESEAYYYWNDETDEVTWDKPGEEKRVRTCSLSLLPSLHLWSQATILRPLRVGSLRIV